MREQDIRKRDVFNKYLELSRLDSEKIFKDKNNFILMNCLACGGNNCPPQFDRYGFTYVKCADCDTLYVNPRPDYFKLMQFYACSDSTKFWVNEFFPPVAEARREIIFKPRAEYIVSHFPSLVNGRIADIGAGFGIFLEELKELWPGSDLTAIEPSVEMANICRQKGFKIIESFLEEVNPSLEKFDLMTAFELFEHFYEPSTFLNRVYNLLTPEGFLFFTTLNGLGFDIQLLWEKSKSVSPPHHLNFFNPFSIRILLEKIGFKVIEVSTPGELDWDIIETGYQHEGITPGRFFETVSKYGADETKKALQVWIKKYGFSSHMRVIAKK